MRILFCALHFNYFRNFDSAVEELARRGHQIHLAADEPESLGGQQLVERLAAKYPGITWSMAPSLKAWTWNAFARKMRLALEHVRFLDPRYDPTPKYRYRSRDRAPRVVRLFGRVPLARTRPARRAMAALLKWIERSIPAAPDLDRFLREQRPDVVLLASVTNPGSPQLNHLKSAIAQGARTALTVWSWDHLSGKAWLHILPDRVLVWNDTQKREAVDLHRVPADRVVVTGAQCFDRWFDRRPGSSREQFCRKVGLDPSRPYILYVCSVLVRPCPPESAFVLEWIEQLRASADVTLRSAGILIRPHPERMDDWQEVDLAGYENVVLYGRNPIDDGARTDYFDSIHHSSAVVGLLTSAFLEASIVGRPVYTTTPERFRIHQAGAPHFQYLVDGDGGLLHVAPTFNGHCKDLAVALNGGDADSLECHERFLTAFVRPMGLSTPATPAFVEAVEELGRSDQPLPRSRPWCSSITPWLERLVASSDRGIVRWLLMDVKEAELRRQEIETLEAARFRKRRLHEEEVRAHQAAKRQYEVQEQQQKRQNLRRKQESERAKRDARAVRIREKRRRRLRMVRHGMAARVQRMLELVRR